MLLLFCSADGEGELTQSFTLVAPAEPGWHTAALFFFYGDERGEQSILFESICLCHLEVGGLGSLK